MDTGTSLRRFDCGMSDDADAAASGRDDPDSGDWDADLYDGSHAFVHEYGADVLDLLEPAAGERVLDLGCGTGHLTAEIAASGATAVGFDRSPSMVASARERYPHVPFAVADARQPPFHDSFDAVFSNAALHWIPEADQRAAAAGVRDALRPGGRFVAELGGAGNVQRVVDALSDAIRNAGHLVADPWYFPSIGEYANLLEDVGFTVRYARLFDRPTTLDGGREGLRTWLSMFGDGFFDAVPAADRDRVISRVEAALEPALFDGDAWVADYTRLRVVAEWPD